METSPNPTKSAIIFWKPVQIKQQVQIGFLQIQQKVQIFSLVCLEDLHTLLYPRVLGSHRGQSSGWREILTSNIVLMHLLIIWKPSTT